MSNLIVTNVTPENNEPFTINGSKTLVVDTIQDHLGESKSVAKIAQVHTATGDAAEYEFVYDSNSEVISLKTPEGFATLQAIVSNAPINEIKTFTATGYQVTGSFTDLPFNPSIASGTHVLRITVSDPTGLVGVYSGIVPFVTVDDQPVLSDTQELITLQHTGEDAYPLAVQLTRNTTGQAIRFQIRSTGSVPGTAHYSIQFKFRLMV